MRFGGLGLDVHHSLLKFDYAHVHAAYAHLNIAQGKKWKLDFKKGMGLELVLPIFNTEM